MIADFAEHARKREGKRNYDELVKFFCENISQTTTWTLILSIANNVRQLTFSSTDANEMVKTLCREFGIKASAIQYFKTFSSPPFRQASANGANVIRFTSKKAGHETNNERLIHELHFAIRERTIEYRQALDLVMKIIESYPETKKNLQG